VHCLQSYEINSGICHASALGGWLVAHLPHPCPQHLFLSLLLLAVVDSSPHPHSPRLVQRSTLPALSVVDYSSLCFSVLLWGGVYVTTSCNGVCSGAGGSVCGAWYSPVVFEDLPDSFETGLAGRNGGQLFSRQMLTGVGFSLARCR
jgi:hypothetical protein